MARPVSSPSLESLEARQLMSFTNTMFPDVYGLKDFLYEFAQPSSATTPYGSALAGLGDINKDGFADFAVARPEKGSVDVFSGKDQSALRHLQVSSVPMFGMVLTNVGDVNGDGTPDLAVGSPLFDTDDDGILDTRGRVWVYSGSDGSVIHILNAAGDSDELGYAIAAPGDMNGDGAAEVIVAAPGAGPSGQGQVYVYSGSDWSVLHTFTGEAAGDRFGQALAVRDVPASGTGVVGDGVADIAIGATGVDRAGSGGADQGRVYFYDGATFAKRYQLEEVGPASAYGTTIAFARGGDQLTLLVGSRTSLGGSRTQFTPTVRFYDAITGLSTGQSITEGITDSQVHLGVFSGVRYPDRDFIVLSAQANIEGDFVWTTRAFDATAQGAQKLSLFDQPSPTGFPAPVGRLGPVLAAAGDVDGDGVPDVLTASVTADGEVKVWSGLSGRMSFYPAVGETLPFYRMSGITDDGRGLWSTPDVDGGGVVSGQEVLGLFIYKGQARTFAAVPGLGRAVIVSVNNDGVIAGADLVASGTGTDILGDRFVLKDGVKTYLKDLITSVSGSTAGPDLSTISGLKIGNGGEIIFSTAVGSGFGAWMVKGNTATFLWDGVVVDVNTAGTVLGVQFHPGEVGVTTLAFADGHQVTIPDLFNPGAINDRGVVAGQSGLAMAIWDNGQILALPQPSLPPTPPPSSGPSTPIIQTLNWHARDIANDGTVVGSFEATTIGPGLPMGEVVYRPGVGTNYVVYLLGFETNVPVRLTETGWIYNNRFIAVPKITLELEADSPVVSITGPDGTVTVGITLSGQGYATAAVNTAPLPSDRFGQVLFTAGPQTAGPKLVDIDAYLDPKDGKVYVVGIADDGSMFWWQLFRDDQFAFQQRIGASGGDTAIRSKLTVLIGADKVVRLAGLNGSGEVVLVYQNGLADPSSPSNWSASNLSKDHLRPQGLVEPLFVSDLTAFVAPWNGMNIAGLDAQGRIWTVWWTPGLALWRADDLSASAGAAALTGNITGYSTSWGGLNVAGTDVDGNVLIAWWAPGMAAWTTSQLPGGTMAPGSISSYVTPWGGLNIAGIDTDGTVTVAWWAPGLTDWTFSTIDPDLGRLGSGAVGHVMVAGSVTSAGGIELFYRQPADDTVRPWLKEGHLVRLYLDPQLAAWMAMDATVEDRG